MNNRSCNVREFVGGENCLNCGCGGGAQHDCVPGDGASGRRGDGSGLQQFSFFSGFPLVADASWRNQDARQLRRQGDDALLLRRWDEAVDVLSKSIALEPENFLGFLKRASAYQGLGKLNEAVQDLTKVLAIKPDHAKAVVKRAELFVSLGRYLEAQHSLFGVAGPEATALLATTSRLVMLRNTITQFAERKEFANAIRTIDEMVAAGANRDLLAMEKCKLAFESGQYYDVVAEAMSLLKKDAANTDALLIRARSFFMLGEVDACVNHLKQCIRVQPDHTACGEEYKRVLAVNAKREAATTLFKSNQWMQSVTPLREAIEAAKPVAALQLELTAMLCEAFEKGATSIAQWTEGVAACTAAMAVPGASDAMKEWRGNLHQKLGNWNEAIQDFSAVLQTQPNNMRMRQRIQEVQNAKKVRKRCVFLLFFSSLC